MTLLWFERIINNHIGKQPQGRKLNANLSALLLIEENPATEPEDPSLSSSFKSDIISNSGNLNLDC